MIRLITTTEELSTLPDRSIILDADDVTYRLNPWDSDGGWFPYDGHSHLDRDFGVKVEAVALPAALLHVGGLS